MLRGHLKNKATLADILTCFSKDCSVTFGHFTVSDILKEKAKWLAVEGWPGLIINF